jgi:glutathione S-transferase
MSIVFYFAPMSSATPVACALAELSVPHEAIAVDLASKLQKTPEFLRLNPNGKVPTLVVDGNPMFEGLAILLWLGERFGVEQGLWPEASDSARLAALSWSAWAYVTVAPTIARLLFATSPRVAPEMHNAAQAELARTELAHLMSMLDERLGNAPYLLGKEYSLVDLIVASVVGYGTFAGLSLDRHAPVKRWLDLCQARPSFRSVLKPA